MLINIPLEIDDAAIEGKLTKDYEEKLLHEIAERVERKLEEEDSYSRWNGRSAEGGLGNLIDSCIDRKIDAYLYDHKAEITDSIVKNLANRIAKTKKYREVKEDA